MTEERIELGRRGEDLIASLIESKGWHVLARNVRLSGGELDLIARVGDTLVFIEVKTLRTGRYQANSSPERAVLAVDRKKQSRIRRLAAEWLTAGQIPHGIAEFRFDVFGVEFDRQHADLQPRIEHIESAF